MTDRRMLPCNDEGTLYRGDHELPYQCQRIRRDLHGEQILMHLGEQVMGYRLTPDQVQERRHGVTPGLGLPYEFLLYVPGSYATSWTAFYTLDDLLAWMRAYCVTYASEPEPGTTFQLTLPTDEVGFLTLRGAA